MNPVFFLLVILIGIMLWFSINSLFPLIGDFICGLWEEAKFNMEQNDKKNEE